METSSPWRLKIVTLPPLPNLVPCGFHKSSHKISAMRCGNPFLIWDFQTFLLSLFFIKKGKKVNDGEDIWKRDEYPSGVIPILTAE